MGEAMTPRERWLAAVRMQPVDRLPFWPKLGSSYAAAQEAPFRAMDLDAIHDWIGSDKHKDIGDCVKEVRTRTSVERVQSNGTMQTVYRTPHGEARLIEKFDGPSDSWHPVEFPVRTVEDVKLMTDIFRDVRVDFDRQALEESQARAERIGEDACTTNTIGESPLMYWVEWLAGIENAHYLLADHQGEVEELFDLMHSVLKRRAELLSEHSPADVLYMVENTSTTLISPAQYGQYCARHIGEYARITSSAGRNMVLHMCGHLKALLPDLARIPAQAFEAFTSPTLGNTTLLDGRSYCPDKCLIGGTNAMLWTKPADVIIEQIERDLDALPHHRGIVVTSAGVMPPLCKPETIREVCRWVKAYPHERDEG